ncbi:MAG: three-Cys-motif partner protein TcmP [Gammaproteobacteria bacterium]|nr:three-Cys-motif partner protein TcmP [Gammaproteobacteria bacterium]
MSQSDGLPVRACGRWTEEKLWFWNRYLEITTSSMVGHPKWRQGLTYIDLFCGPGICEVRDTKKRLPGSVLLAGMTLKPFSRILACDLDASNAQACESRLRDLGSESECKFIAGDCNEVIADLMQHVPISETLSLVFVDPEGFDVKWSTLECIANSTRADFLILFADAIDLVRNVDLYETDPESKLFAAFPSEEFWRESYSRLEDRSGPKVRALFAASYERALREALGYEGVAQRVIRGPRGPLYRLIYASRHQLGLSFWNKVSQRDIGGQAEWGWS